MKTPELKTETDDKAENIESQDSTGFWQRFMKLFKE